MVKRTPEKSLYERLPREEALIVARLSRLIGLRKITIKELAERIGIPYGTLQSYIQGKHSIPAVVVAKCARELGVGADWLLLGEAAVFDKEILDETFLNLDEARVRSPKLLQLHEYYSRFFEMVYKSTFRSNNRFWDPGSLGDDDNVAAGDTTEEGAPKPKGRPTRASK